MASLIAQLSVLLGTILASVPDSDVDAYRAALRRRSIDDQPAGALKFLQQLRPGGELDRANRAAAADLDHREYDRRARATRALREAPFVAEDLLVDEALRRNPETRWRLDEIARAAGPRQRYAVYCALQVVRQAPPAESTAAVLELLPALGDRQLVHVAWQVLAEAARPADRAVLENELRSASGARRAGAASALGAVLLADSPLWTTLTNDRSPFVPLAAAISAARRGEARGFQVLTELLASEHALVRQEADRALTILTGTNLGFDFAAPPARRERTAAAWRDWLAHSPPKVVAPLPHPIALTGRGQLGGTTLVATGSYGLVLEFAADGRLQWRFPQSAWNAEPLPGGTIVMASLDEQRVVEVDRSGRILWQYGPVAATRAQPLANGHFLVVDFQGSRVLEIDRARNVVSEIPTPDPCFDAQRLANGHTVFGCANLAREVAPDGATVREWKISGRLNSLQVLTNGRLLIANYGANEVVELARDGAVTNRISEPQPCDARRLADGRTLVTTATRVVEFSERGELEKVWATARYGTARRDGSD